MGNSSSSESLPEAGNGRKSSHVISTLHERRPKPKGELKLPMVQFRREKFMMHREKEMTRQEHLRQLEENGKGQLGKTVRSVQQQQKPNQQQREPNQAQGRAYQEKHKPYQGYQNAPNEQLTFHHLPNDHHGQHQPLHERPPGEHVQDLGHGHDQNNQVEQLTTPSLPRPRPLPLPLPRTVASSPNRSPVRSKGGRSSLACGDSGGGAHGGSARVTSSAARDSGFSGITDIPTRGGGGGITDSPAHGGVQISDSSAHGALSRLSVAPLQIQDDIGPDDIIKLKLLGHGSGGKVYKVQHKVTRKVYALKVIQEKHELAVRRQILREMDILRRSSSPCIVSCYGVADKACEIYFVLEYMDGGSLADVLEVRKKIPEMYISELSRQVLKGLDYLHRNKIIHRDIKPSNLLLNHQQEVKIADFGVSTILASTMAPCNTFVGTCAYLSPERFDPDSHGGNYIGYVGDIWSLGLSLLESAIGHFPFLAPGQKPDWPTLMVAICYGDPPQAPPDASLEFKDFIKRCLWKAPEWRPRASDLLTHPFITKYENSACNISDLLQPLNEIK